MRTILIFSLAILFSFFSLALADEYTIESELIDFRPGDGLFEVGSPSNPIYIVNDCGEVLGTISSEMNDYTPGDGLFETGSPSNPWILTTED